MAEKCHLGLASRMRSEHSGEQLQEVDHPGEGDTLAVVRLDRLGRSLGELLTTVAMLKEHGIALLSLEKRIDTN